MTFQGLFNSTATPEPVLLIPEETPNRSLRTEVALFGHGKDPRLRGPDRMNTTLNTTLINAGNTVAPSPSTRLNLLLAYYT